jgi:hypothetical protein
MVRFPVCVSIRISPRLAAIAVRAAWTVFAASIIGSASARCEASVIVTYSHPAYVGSPLIASIGFLPALNELGRIAQDAGVRIRVTHSFRAEGTALTGAIVPPARRSNHLVGHAIDMNVVRPDGTLCNSRCLRGYPNIPLAVRRFIDAVRAHPLLRWGGDFSVPDVVHVDDGFNLREPNRWSALYPAAQRAFADRCHEIHHHGDP